MKVITTRSDGTPIAAARKPFSWSYSRLKNFENCPKKSYHVDIAKDVAEERSEQLDWGDLVHAAAAKRLGQHKVPLPQGMEILAPWIDKIEAGPPATILVEQKLAIAADFGACTYFAKEPRPAWLRVVVDVLKIAGPVALAVDWKTGKILEDSVQLALNAQCIFSHYPEIKKIRTEFIWLKDDATSRADFERSDMPGLWANLLPRVDALRNAVASMNFPPRPSGLCKRFCPVTQCPHHGIGSY